jgi:DNA repair protein SbcD/Mre11
MPMKVLCAGDLHIGRRASRIPAGLERSRASCASAWKALVRCALDERVEVVALSGDIVDQDNRYYEALGPLEEGIRQLTDAGIDVCAVAGNHDFDVLPSLARTVGRDRFHLLGQRGEWQDTVIRRNGNAIRLLGWSFPERFYPRNPLHGCPAGFDDGIPTLGLLHADLDQPESRYAPVRTPDFHLRGDAMWLLGHIHKPGTRCGGAGPTVLYPGSPLAMDPGETGWHGAYLAEFDGVGRVKLRERPLSVIRYDVVKVDLTGVDSEEQLQPHIAAALRAWLREVSVSCGPLECMHCRVLLSGRTALHGRLARLVDEMRGEDVLLRDGAVCLSIEKFIVDTAPKADLVDLARGSDPPALLARLILRIESGESMAANERLWEAAVRQSQSLNGHSQYRALEPLPATDEKVRLSLLTSARALLDTLLRQKEAR